MNRSELLLALGFGNWLMLSWLAAAAVPLAIHLWNRRRYREVSWAAIEYLLAALRKNARRIQIEQWVLLAIRTLIIVLVALAVAEPYLEGARLDFSTGQRTLKVLVIDGSFSMAYRATDKTRFERAKSAAEKIVEESPAGDAFLLVVLADPPVVVVGTPAHEPSDFLQEIDNLRLAQGLADLPATLARVEEVLSAAGGSAPARREVIFLTDLARNTWAPQLTSPEADNQISRPLEPARRPWPCSRSSTSVSRRPRTGPSPAWPCPNRLPLSAAKSSSTPACNRSPPHRGATNWSSC